MKEENWGEINLHNKRNTGGFDPFIPIKLSSIEKNKLTESISVNNSTFVDSPLNFSMSSDTFKMDLPSVKKGFVVLLTKKSIGTENELGIKLMNDFVISISDAVMLPQYVIIMNEAVCLFNDSLVKECFAKMQKYGVKILVSDESARCFDDFKDVRGVKQVTSADIAEKIIYSEHLVTM